MLVPLAGDILAAPGGAQAITCFLESFITIATRNGPHALPLRGSLPPRGRILASPHFVNLGAARWKIGKAPRAPAIERFRAMLSAPGSMLTASMLRELENGGPIEADPVEGYMLKKTQAHGRD